jgi:hypothetical protein
MSKSNQHKPGGKPGQQPSQKPNHEPGLSLKSAKQPDGQSPIKAAVAAPAAVTSPDAFSVRGTAPAKTPSIDFQTIAMAYGDYTKKSYEQTKSYVEKLAGVRSLDKAIEIQTEFAKQAYETFVHESQKIRELYSGLARQTVEGAVAKVLPAAR